MLEKTEGASKIGQSRETGNVGDTRQQKAQHQEHLTFSNISILASV
jgi:hypothetical protein